MHDIGSAREVVFVFLVPKIRMRHIKLF